MRWFALILTSLVLTSCAALQENYKQQCAARDWNKTGYNDALAGNKPNSYELNQCMSSGAPLNRSAYDNGYVDGLKQFCTYDYGVYFGREGKEYNNTCTPSVMNAFLAGYSKGKMEYQRLNVAKDQVEAIRQINAPAVGLPGMGQRPVGQACTFNSDCDLQVSCSMTSEPGIVKRCEGSGKICTFDSDCKVQGFCSNSTCVWH